MEELLQKLLEAEILSDSTKSELQETFNSKLQEAIEEVKTETEVAVKAELSEQFVSERENLIEALDTKVTQFLNEEFGELREDINRFRDLELEYAEKLVEAKAQMSNELKGDLKELVERMDSFLEIRINTELKELREDIEINKQNNFGRKIFEAIAAEYRNNYADDDNLAETLAETEKRLADTEETLSEAETRLNDIERTNKLSSILSPLTGKHRDVMEAILKNVATEQLEEGYNTFIGRVLKEDVMEDDDLVTENHNKNMKSKKDYDMKDMKSKKDADMKKMVKEGRVISGDIDQDDNINNNSKLSESSKSRLLELAGIAIKK